MKSEKFQKKTSLNADPQTEKASKKSKKNEEELSPKEQVISWVKTIVGAIVVVTILNGILIASFVVPTPSMEKTVMTGDFLFVNKFVYGPSTPQVVPFLNIPLPFYKTPPIMQPEKGDVIVFIFPGNRDEVEPTEFVYYLKRCVATAGDTLQVINKRLFVNHKEYPLPEHGVYDYSEPVTPAEKFQTYPFGKGWTRDDYGPIRIPKKGDIIPLTLENYPEWGVFIAREGHEITTNGNVIMIDNKPATSYKVERNYAFGMGDNRDHSWDSRFWGFIPVDNIVGSPLIIYWSWDTNLPLSKFFDKLASIRFSRIAHTIH